MRKAHHLTGPAILNLLGGAPALRLIPVTFQSRPTGRSGVPPVMSDVKIRDLSELSARLENLGVRL